MKKLKHYLLLLSLCLLLFRGLSQNNISPQWLINSSGDKWDVVCDMVAGTDSCFYLAGNYTASSKINDRTTTLTGEDNSFIIKLNRDGNQLWQTHIISAGYSNISSLSCDNDGAVYACGTFRGGLNVGAATVESHGVKSLFILKLDKSGEVAMLQQIPGNFSNSHITITNNSHNELLLAASFKGSLKIDNRDYTSLYYYDILIAKIDNNGDLINVNILKGKSDDEVNNIVCSGEDEIYITGSFKKDLLFGNKKMRTTKKSDAFLIKLTNDFEFIYGKQIGGIYDDYGKNISIDDNGNVLLAGSFAGEIMLTGGYKLTSNGVLDVFIIKYDKNGNLVWADSFGGGANDYISSMTLSPAGNIYINGTYRGEIKKENLKIESSEFSNDIFLAKYNTNGKFRFLETAGDTNVDFGRKLISDTEGYIYLSGDFSRSLKFLDKETTEAVDNDFFIARLYDCEENLKVQLPADTTLCAEQYIVSAGDDFTEYFWNGQSGSHELTIDSTGTYTIEVIDEFGCVSMDTIIVNLFPIPTFDLGDTIFALKGELITIDAPDGMEEYLWNDGSTLSFLDVNTKLLEAGKYNFSVEIEDENSCRAADDITLIVFENAVLAENLPFKDDFENTVLADIGNDSGEMIVKVFPNPAKDKLEIHLEFVNINEILVGNLKLFSTAGTLLIEKELETENNKCSLTLNLENIITGTYYILIKTNHHSFWKKVIVL